MEKKSLISLAALMFLAACECCSDEIDQVEVVQDDSLSTATADFIANAGDRVHFDFDKSTLSEESKATLGRQADWLQSHQQYNVLIEGHCDERGTREYNLGLGERRADAAARFLTEKGIAGDRIRTVSYGKDRPIAATGSQEEIYRLNRVAISVLEKN
ncbi:MAG: OmpA family protein [Alphaproteobacteria bacterium]|nr:OmpA family protein [Alphaproteobacteria bacterium]